jgi:hypothetical protein
VEEFIYHRHCSFPDLNFFFALASNDIHPFQDRLIQALINNSGNDFFRAFIQAYHTWKNS